MSKPKVICDQCRTEFKIKKIKKKLFWDDHERVFLHYFSCPRCKKNYLSQAENTEVREIIKEVQALNRKKQRVALDKNIGEEEYIHAIDRINDKTKKLQAKAKSISDELKTKFIL